MMEALLNEAVERESVEHRSRRLMIVNSSACKLGNLQGIWFGWKINAI